MSSNKTIPTLSEIMIAGAELPARIFTRQFDQYLFSDVDIVSCVPMIDSVRAIMNCCNYLDAGVDVFSSWNREHLFHLDAAMDWPTELIQLRKVMHNDGDHGGLTLLDSKCRWIAYQYFPVEIGILAIESRLDLSLIAGVKDSFFSCSDLVRLCRRENQHDIDLVDDNFGLDVLNSLIKNYC